MSRSTVYEDVFEDIDENMKQDTFYTWDDIAKRFFHIEIVSKERNKKDRYMYISLRNRYMKAVNSLSFKYKKGWMLFIGKHNTHIVKTSNKKLMEKICDIRTTKFFNACSTMIKQGNWILENEHIDSKKKRIFRPFINGMYGLATILIGLIQKSKMPKEEKEQLLSKAKFFINEEE